MKKGKKRSKVIHNSGYTKKVSLKNYNITVLKGYNTKWKCIFCYVTVGLLGLYYFFRKSENDYVRFIGLQSALMNISAFIFLCLFILVIPNVIVPSIVMCLMAIINMSGIHHCYNEKLFKMPKLGEIVEKIVLKKK